MKPIDRVNPLNHWPTPFLPTLADLFSFHHQTSYTATPTIQRSAKANPVISPDTSAGPRTCFGTMSHAQTSHGPSTTSGKFHARHTRRNGRRPPTPQSRTRLCVRAGAAFSSQPGPRVSCDTTRGAHSVPTSGVFVRDFPRLMSPTYLACPATRCRSRRVMDRNSDVPSEIAKQALFQHPHAQKSLGNKKFMCQWAHMRSAVRATQRTSGPRA